MNVILLISLATFISTLVGGLLAIRFKKCLPYFFAFSAGALIAVSFLDLLPESFEIANEINLPLRYIMIVIVASFLFYSLLEKYFLAHQHEDDDHGHPLGPIGAGSLVIHSFLDGMAIGASYLINPATGLIVALAVISHDFTDGINTVTLMLKNKQGMKRAFIFLILDALAPVLGVLLTYFLSIPKEFIALVLAFFVGEFLYIGAANLLPETHKHKSILIPLCLMLGAIIILVLTSII